MKFAKLILSSILLIALTTIVTRAQTPAPIVVQAASNAPASTEPAAKAPAPDTSSVEAAIKFLEEMKATNAEILKRQEASLQQLSDLQQAAEQLKIFSKRG